LSQNDNIFWVAGKPGSGKSTLIKYITQSPALRARLRGARPLKGLIIAQHFFDHKSPGLAQSFEGLLRSLLWQILQQEEKLFKYVLPTFGRLRSKQSKLSWTRADLFEVLEKILKDSYDDRTFCFIVDALDECTDDHDELSDFFSKWLSSKARNDILKICLSSRPDVEFLDEFRNGPYLNLQEQTIQDIERYSQTVCQHLWSHPVRKYRDLVQYVIDCSEGVFLWVKLVCEKIRRSAQRGEDPRKLKCTLLELPSPSELSKLFERIFFQIDENERGESYSMLAAVAASQRPLTLIELRCTLIYGDHDQDFDQTFPLIRVDEFETSDFYGIQVHGRELLKRRIQSITGGLLETRPLWNEDNGLVEEVVVALHETVRVFLTELSLPPLMSNIECIIQLGHLLHLKAATQYLGSLTRSDLPYGRADFTILPPREDSGPNEVQDADDSTEFDRVSLGSRRIVVAPGKSFRSWCSKYTYLWYATDYWATHAKQLPTELSEIHIDALEGDPFLIWREVFAAALDSRNYSAADRYIPMSLLEQAAANSCSSYVMRKIQDHPGLLERTDGIRLLYAATRSGSEKLCSWLLKSDTIRPINTNSLKESLFIAIDFEHISLIPLLLDHGVDPGRTSFYQITCQTWTTSPNIRISTSFIYSTPLSLAVLLHLNYFVRSILYHHRVRSDIEDLAFATLKSYLQLMGCVEPINESGINLLCRFGAHKREGAVTHPSESLLGMAILAGRNTVLSSLLNAGASPNLECAQQSLLAYCFALKHYDAVDTLLDYGVHLDVGAFQEALSSSPWNLDSWNRLISHRNGLIATLGVNYLIDYSTTALHVAVEQGHYSAVENLLHRYRASPNIRNNSGNYPLHVALKSRVKVQLDIFRQLIINGARIGELDGNGASPFILALIKDRFDVVALLLNEGLEISVQDLRDSIKVLETQSTPAPIERRNTQASDNLFSMAIHSPQVINMDTWVENVLAELWYLFPREQSIASRLESSEPVTPASRILLKQDLIAVAESAQFNKALPSDWGNTPRQRSLSKWFNAFPDNSENTPRQQNQLRLLHTGWHDEEDGYFELDNPKDFDNMEVLGNEENDHPYLTYKSQLEIEQTIKTNRPRLSDVLDMAGELPSNLSLTTKALVMLADPGLSFQQRKYASQEEVSWCLNVDSVRMGTSLHAPQQFEPEKANDATGYEEIGELWSLHPTAWYTSAAHMAPVVNSLTQN
jgi:ankyrin repeat protein